MSIIRLRGRPVGGGKTQVLRLKPGVPGVVRCRSKDVITWSDRFQEPFPGKARLSTEVSVNVFELLKKHGIPVAYLTRFDSVTFEALRCRMFRLEVVGRLRAAGSYARRYGIREGVHFQEPVVEIFLKTKNKNFEGNELQVDDPYLEIGDDMIRLYHPLGTDMIPFLSLPLYQYGDLIGYPYIALMKDVTKQVGRILGPAWKNLNFDLFDFKLEFGLTTTGELVVADIFSNDEHRLQFGGEWFCKQSKRNGEPQDTVAAKYAFVAARSRLLGL